MKAALLFSIGLTLVGTSSAFAQTPQCDYQLDLTRTLHFQVDGIQLADSSTNRIYLAVGLVTAKDQPVPESIQKLAIGGTVPVIAYGSTKTLAYSNAEKYSSHPVLSLDLPVAELVEALSRSEDSSSAEVVIQVMRANRWRSDKPIVEEHIPASQMNANIANGPCMKPAGDADIVSKSMFVDGDGNLAGRYITIK